MPAVQTKLSVSFYPLNGLFLSNPKIMEEKEKMWTSFEVEKISKSFLCAIFRNGITHVKIVAFLCISTEVWKQETRISKSFIFFFTLGWGMIREAPPVETTNKVV